MKRPEGFDPEHGTGSKPASSKPVGSRTTRTVREQARPTRPKSPPTSAQSTRATSTKNPPAKPTTKPATTPGSTPEPSDRDARRELRRAARDRRRYERSEVRRFTRHSRRRRVTWLVVLGIALTMGTLVAVAVYSPLLALKTIQIEGASRISPDDIHAAVDGQLDTPLALVDFDLITEELGDFPLIRSYVTEMVPPDTLVIHIVEREPIGSLAADSGFALVDPAGIVIERSEARLPGVPLIDIAGADTDSEAFDAAVEVILALPDSVLGQLDTVTASTRDNVRLTLAGGGAEIIWGSADDSDYKARLLAVALAQKYPNVSEYNVSAPGQLTYR